MAAPWPTAAPTAQERASLADAAPVSYWLDQLPSREPYPVLRGDVSADLCIVGGGFSGLWAAVHAKTEDPGRDVLLVEGGTIGRAASGRNGGFCDASLTHGLSHGAARFGGELAALDRLGRENLRGLLADLERLGIDAHAWPAAELLVALQPHEIEWVREEAALHRDHGYVVEEFDRSAVRRRIASPTYLYGAAIEGSLALVDPARLGDGLRAAAQRLGVRLHEGSVVAAVGEGRAGGLRLRVRDGDPARPARYGGRHAGAAQIEARRVVLATGAHRSLIGAVRRRVAPVYDYVLMTEPLSEAQWASIGWLQRDGVSDVANQFHYYRPTADGRILWGGFDAVHRFAGAVHAERDRGEATWLRLAQHFFATFPQLRGVRFSHAWGGAIDTSPRFAAFFGTALAGRLAYVSGYTGLGVGASRWGGRVALDLVDGRETESTRLRAVRSLPLPFPPEPLRTPAVVAMQRALARADARGGRRGPLLRATDALGVGFDT